VEDEDRDVLTDRPRPGSLAKIKTRYGISGQPVRKIRTERPNGIPICTENPDRLGAAAAAAGTDIPYTDSLPSGGGPCRCCSAAAERSRRQRPASPVSAPGLRAAQQRSNASGRNPGRPSASTIESSLQKIGAAPRIENGAPARRGIDVVSAARKMPIAGHERAVLVAEMEDLREQLAEADDAGQATRLRATIAALQQRMATHPRPRR
jgi:hypothetical protein